MKLQRTSIVLGSKDTRRYENDGPDGDRFRHEINGLARAHATRIGRAVTVYASNSVGGYAFAHFEPSSSAPRRD
jgi:hypothetical protein